MTRCTVEGCGRHPLKRGMCNAHYLRWWRHGDPLKGGTSKKAAQNFLRNVALHYGGDDCLTWPFHRTREGYGAIHLGGRCQIVSRVVCETINGAPPDKESQAAHSCGNGHLGCVNPRHLRWASFQENRDDMLVHGTTNRGKSVRQNRLSERQRREIRALGNSVPQAAIARKYNVTPHAVAYLLGKK